MTKSTGKTSAQTKKEYERKNFKYQTVCFKLSEIEEIETYCKENKIPKNTLIRQVVMDHIYSQYFN